MIIIEDMEKLPDNCHKCLISMYFEGEYWCPWNQCTVDGHNGKENRMQDCPLKYVEDD